MHMSLGASVLSLLFIAVDYVGPLIQIQSFFVARRDGSLGLL